MNRQRQGLAPLVPGLLLVALGALFLLDNLNVLDFGDAISVIWPSALVLLGVWWLTRGVTLFGLMALVLGAIFLADALGLGVDVGQLWPLLLIGLGLWLLLERRRTRAPRPAAARRQPSPEGAAGPDADTVNITAFFGDAKRRVSSPTFGGGSVTVFIGDAEVDLRGAQHPADGAALRVQSFLGDARVRVPSTWVVRVNGSPLLGDVKDRRTAPPQTGPLLVINATTFLGDVEIDD